MRSYKISMGLIFLTFCWPCIWLQILGNNQLDALFHVFIYLMSPHVSSVTVLIIRGSNCINTSSGKMQFPPDRHTKQSLTQTNLTRWCINTIRSPDDERCDARNMWRHEISKYTKKCVKLVISKNLNGINIWNCMWRINSANRFTRMNNKLFKDI